MLSLYFSLLLVLFFWACACCPADDDVGTGTGSPGTGPIGGCGPCTDIIECWEIAVAGIVGFEGCTTAECDGWNGTFILVQKEVVDHLGPAVTGGGTSCLFETELFASAASIGSPPCARDSFYRLTVVDTIVQELVGYTLNPTVSMGFYDGPIGGFKCLDENVFIFSSTNLGCAGWPATLTVSPVVCP